jgi:hypothetical protein
MHRLVRQDFNNSNRTCIYALSIDGCMNKVLVLRVGVYPNHFVYELGMLIFLLMWLGGF